MSIELPEAMILSRQIDKELGGKCIKSYHLQDHEKLQRIGMMNKDLRSFDQIINKKVESAFSRGNVIRLKLSNRMNLILAPEYGGKILYHPNKDVVPSKFHLRIDFSDDTVLTVRLTSMGLIHVFNDDELEQSYVYKRDFNREAVSPLDKMFTFEFFSRLLEDNNHMLKSVLVGKNAIIVGLSNSAFQDIIYRARLHPKKKGSELNKNEVSELYDAIMLVLRERIKLRGKDQFHDIYGNQGTYVPAMGPNMRSRSCSLCGTIIEKLSVGGGDVYYCPHCQL